MDPCQSSESTQFYSLFEAAQKLAVPVNTLLDWNQFDILKPTLTPAGQVGYSKTQIDQFITIRQLTRLHTPPPSDSPSPPAKTHSTIAPFLSFSAMALALIITVLITQFTYTSPNPSFSSPVSQADLSSSPAPPLPDSRTSSPDQFPSLNTFAQAINPENSDPVFDQNGNLKGPVNPQVLASSIDQNPILQSSFPVKTSPDPSLYLALIILGLIALPWLFTKPAVSLISPIPAPTLPVPGFSLPSPSLSVPAEKVLEINQKTDGTVVLCFKNREYKISKPELDSESDRFIEHLMQLTASHLKEIEYDLLQNSDFHPSAPLSKLVTRLGFVGLKRDLFFPRTSKTRVLFRRYLTPADLIAMNLHPDHINPDLFIAN